VGRWIGLFSGVRRMTRHVLTAEERARGGTTTAKRPKKRHYTESARRIAQDTLKAEIAAAKAEASTAPLFRWWPD
jgi:hypothetical protein